MSEVFGSGYADAYDDLYADKDYDGECDLVESIVAAADPTSTRILDLGCGTGAHAIRLAQRGYQVTGVDRSADMLERAAANARALSGPGAVSFHHHDLLDLDLGETFDAALMMFAVLGYQHSNEEVLAALRTARRHLRDDGLLVFDVWYGPAVLHVGPSERVKVVATDRGEIIRVTVPHIDVSRQLCAVEFRVWAVESDRVVHRTEETHAVRYFFPLELSLFLSEAGFAVVQLGGFPDLATEPDESTWNVGCVARADGPLASS